MEGGSHNDLMSLSKDIGKVAERTGKLEERFASIEARLSEFLSEQKERDLDRAQRDKERDVRDQVIADHMGKVCTAARIGIFLARYILPPGGLAAALLLAKQLGLF